MDFLSLQHWMCQQTVDRDAGPASPERQVLLV